MKQNQTITRLGIILGPLVLALLCGLVAFWVGRQVSGGNATPVVDIPAPRPTATLMSTPTSTATPTSLPTATATPTATSTSTPTPEPSPTPIVTPGKIIDIGRLITAEQDFSVWLTYEDKPKWWPLPFWNNKIILFATGHVQAGVDLDKLQDEDITVSGSRVQITLSPPEIFGEPNLTESEALEGSSFSPVGVDWNIAFAAQEDAKTAILKKAGETELLKTARQNAEDRIELLLRRLGATEVTIKWRDIYF